jgi:hypothetical protein
MFFRNVATCQQEYTVQPEGYNRFLDCRLFPTETTEGKKIIQGYDNSQLQNELAP